MKIVACAALVACLALAAGCADWRRPKVPMEVELLAAPCTAKVDTLLVLLPGARDHAKDFIDEGFVTAVRQRHLAVDIALVEANMPYYRERTIVDRLEADVLAPARARGIRHVWLAGISLGGIGSLIVANERRDDRIDGLLLMAPYLGERAIVAEVGAAGSIARWAPSAAATDDEVGRRIWQWLKELTSSTNPGLPSVWLGYGVDDRFAAGHRLLGAALPKDHVFTAPGGHDWPAWRAVWSAMLDRAPLPRDAACAAPDATPTR